MRPTWHFVRPADIVWIQELTSSRVMAGLAGRHRTLELDARTIARATDVMGEALAGGKFMTRPELGDALEAAGIVVDGQRLPHLIASAEHANVITSGPRRGKQFTYALLAERARKARALDREEALQRLTVTYFLSHGPAQLKDFAWWSGLTTQEIRKGIHLAGDELQHEEIDGNDHWSGADQSAPGRADRPAHLLPNFDEVHGRVSRPQRPARPEGPVRRLIVRVLPRRLAHGRDPVQRRHDRRPRARRLEPRADARPGSPGRQIAGAPDSHRSWGGAACGYPTEPVSCRPDRTSVAALMGSRRSLI